MNNFLSSGALQQDDELVQQSTRFSFVCEQQPTIQEDFGTNNYSYSSHDLRDGDSFAINNSMNSSNFSISEKAKKQRKTTSDLRDGDGKKKKIIHRDIERQRRQEMANLHASLRIQLPLEYIKGKRSVSDLLHEAEKYIKFKEKNVEKLKANRDTLKNLMAGNDLNSINQSSSSCIYLPVDITVMSNFDGGVEILMSVDLRHDGFSLSRVLELVLEEGISVVSCVCTKSNGRILHSIQIEAGHLGGVDIHKLEQKLTDFVNNTF